MRLHFRRRRHRSRRKNQVIPILLTASLTLILAALLLLNHQKTRAYEKLAEQTDVSLERLSVSWQGQQYVLRADIKTVLLIGIDQSKEAVNPGQSDFVTLAVFDPRTESWTLVQFNRDSMCPITMLSPAGEYQGTQTAQLALAHAYGSGGTDSCRNTVEAVENLLYGVPIHDYIRIGIDKISVFNDAVGGVTVTIRDDFSAIDPSMVMGTTMRLKGRQAETFVRTRKGMDDATNVSRMARQRDYLQGWIQAAQKTDEEDLIKPLSQELYTNVSFMQLETLVKTAKNYPSPTIRTIPGTVRQGEEYMEFYPDEEALKSMAIELFFEKE